MPPTVQQGLNTDREKRPRAGEKRSELVCQVKYCNTLPDIPFDPKFITYPFESNRFINYNPTSLERCYKYDMQTEHDLGVTIDLIDPETYTIDNNAQLDPADEKLLEEDIMAPQDLKRSRHHAKSVSWLRRTEYISTEQTRFQPQTYDMVEAKVGHNIKKIFKEQENPYLYMDHDNQIKNILKTFEDAKKPISKHYSKPGVVPVEELPVLPDFSIWKYPCAQVIFDSDPAPAGRPVAIQLEEMSQAMIRGVMDESGEQFVAYFLPTDETMKKRQRDFENIMDYVEDEEYEYKMAREYNWNVKSKASKGYEENYFMVIRQDGIYYNELETRVRLSKRRLRQGQHPSNSTLVVKHRFLNAQEQKMQRYRERALEPLGEEEEDEEEEQEMEVDEERNEEEGKGEEKDDEEGDEKDDEEGEEKDDEEGEEKDDEEVEEKDDEGEEKEGRGENKSDEEKDSSAGEKDDSDRESAEDEKNKRSERRGSGTGEGNENDTEEKAERKHDAGSANDAEKSEKEETESQSGSERSRSRSHSHGSRSKSVSVSPARRSLSRSKSRSHSPLQSKKNSPQRQRESRGKSRSRSRSKSRSKSRSQSRSRSGSPSGRSGSGSRSGFDSGSENGSGKSKSDSESEN